MNKTKKLVQTVQLALAIAIILFGYTRVRAMPIKTLLFVQNPNKPSNPVKSPSTRDRQTIGQRFQRATRTIPDPPSDIGAPTRRSHAGSRGCRDSAQQHLSTKTKFLTALAPIYQTQDSESVVWGLTTLENPHFWFYVPYQLTSNHAVEFVLQDDRGNYLYRTKFSGTGTLPGILSVQLPSNVSLQTEQNYSWHFLIYCDSSTPSSYVNGLIKRVELSRWESQLNSLTPQERAILYANEGIWYDTLTELAQLRRVAPQNDRLTDDWVSLLQSVGLEELDSEPLIPCCPPEVLQPISQ